VTGGDEMTDEESTNLETRKSLIAINQSLHFSEIMENGDIELAIPFDKISIGSELKNYMGNYSKDSLFHRSSIETLVIQNVYNLLQKQR
jgi:hypothetical protein